MKYIKFRHWFMVLGSIVVIALWLLTDPDNGLISQLKYGASTVATLVILLKSILYISMLYLARKAILDYLDLEAVFKKAMETPDGAGNVFVGVGVIFLAIAVVIYASVRF